MPLRQLAIAAILSLTQFASASAQSVDTVLQDLDYPWDIEMNEGTLYVTEKAGTLGVFSNEVFSRFPVVTSEPIFNNRGGGLLGMALHPDFRETGRIVLYHHTGTTQDRRNRVIEVTLDGDVWRETRVLIDNIPGHPLYNGGRVAFGPDGMLYITTGWTENRDLPQDLNSLAGKILRVTPDGGIPDDNPFQGSPVWSLGHRNPQGLAWSDDGSLFAAEHGQSGHDEVNRIERGANYGWPLMEGDETSAGMRTSLAHSGDTTWAPSGLAWDGDRLLVASLRSRGLLAVEAETGEVTDAVRIGDRIRDVITTDDGLYAITTNRSPRRDGPSEDRLIIIRQ